MPTKFISLADKMEAYADCSGGPDACWEWARCRERYGYVVWKGKTYLAHRVAWSLVHGDIPPGMQVCHACDNPACVNPAHLWLGTASENIVDCVRKGRHVANPTPQFGEKNGFAKVTEQQVCEMRSRFRNGETKLAIARDMGLSPSGAGDIIRGRVWKHVHCAEGQEA